ncbi:hypothetical protein [Pseudomonas sp. 25 R 14]|nr:hypothetical protein [Pseudomonas sp. 25 R 14]
MLDQPPTIVSPPLSPDPIGCEAYCTVVFRLPGGRTAVGALLLELSRQVEGSATAEIVKLRVGDPLCNRC